MKPWVSDENNCKTESITINSEGKIVAPSSTIAKITLGGTAGAWTLYDGSYYLYAAGNSTSKKQNYLKGTSDLGTGDDAAKYKASITISKDKATITFGGSAVSKVVKYNSSSSLFSCYSTPQDDIYIFRKDVSTKKPAGIAYAEPSYKVNVGESYIKPELNNPNELTPISYSIKCNPEGVATIDEKNGEVTLAGIEGIATVTAKTDATETYAEGIATCTIKVVDPTNVYELVTDASVLKAGDKIIITSGKSGKVNAMKPWVFDENNCKPESIEIGEDGKITSPSSTIAKITLGGTSGAWTLYDGTYYLYAASSSNNHLKGREELGIDDNDIATIKIGETTNNATIKFQGNYTHNSIRYNSNNGTPIFSCYESGQADIYIFRKAGDFSNTLTIGDDKFATFYSADAYIMPEGVTGGTITAADTQSGKLTINYTYTAGTTVPAKTALLLKGEPKTYNYAKTTSSADAPAGNLLHGADALDAEGKTSVEGTNVKYYILSHSTDATKKLGFYWAAANGAAIKYQEPYAFLAIDAAGSGAPIMLSIDGDDDTTAINGITNDTITDNTMYNLAGQRVNANAKGIIIINGKKVIKR